MEANTAYPSDFTDITGSEWYADAVGCMTQLGIVSGCSDGTFGGDKLITRAEFAVIISRFDTLLWDAENTFTDIPDRYWAKNYIASVALRGWASGCTDGIFRPEISITRAEVVIIVNRMPNRICDTNFIASNAGAIKRFSDLNTDHWAYCRICEAPNTHDYERGNNTEIWTALQ